MTLGYNQNANKIINSISQSFKKMVAYGMNKTGVTTAGHVDRSKRDASTASDTSSSDTKAVPKNTKVEEAADIEKHGASGASSFRSFQDQLKQIRLGQ